MNKKKINKMERMETKVFKPVPLDKYVLKGENLALAKKILLEEIMCDEEPENPKIVDGVYEY